MSDLNCRECERPNLAVFACPNDPLFCLACCCSEHGEEGWTMEDTEPDSDTCEKCHALIHGGNPFSRFCDVCLEVNS